MTSNASERAVARLASALSEISCVRLAFLFGSRARGRARPDSDFDIAVLVDDTTARDERGGVLRSLIGRLGREVSSAHIDLVILNDAPALLRHRVLRDGVLICQRSTEERVRFAIRTIRDYQDGSVRRDELTRRRIQRLKARQAHGRSGDLLEKARGVARLLGKAKELS